MGERWRKVQVISCWVGWDMNNHDYQIRYHVHSYCSGTCVAKWEVPFGVIRYVLHFVVQRLLKLWKIYLLFFLLLITVREW